MLRHIDKFELEAAAWLPWMWLRYMAEAHFTFLDLMLYGNPTSEELRLMICMQPAS